MKIKLILCFVLLANTFFGQRVTESIETKKIGTRAFTVVTPPSYESSPEKNTQP